MTAHEIALSMISCRPCTVGMIVGKLLEHGIGYPSADRQAKEALAALVINKRAEVVRVGNADVYVISQTTPVEQSTEPAPKAKGVRR